MIAPQFVKPYVKANKTDRADAEAISEAVQLPSMRYVGVRSVAQQDQQAVHRIRSLAVGQRTALVNQMRGLLAEYGVEIAQGRSQVRQALPGILEDGENGLSPLFRASLGELYEALVPMDERIAELDQKIGQMAQADEQARRLMTIPGIGVMTATALLAAAGDIHAFHNGREFAAWLGLVPRQHSTGGRTGCWASASAVTGMCAACWCMAPVPWCAGPTQSRRIPAASGWAVCWRGGTRMSPR